MLGTPDFENAVGILRAVKARKFTGVRVRETIEERTAVRDQVLARFQPIFRPENLPALTEEQFRDFLIIKNNRHWKGLQRMGPAICKDMKTLRKALAILLDESHPIAERLNQLIPLKGQPMVPRLARAVITPILLIAHPDKYGVWNNVSGGTLQALGIWPEFGKRMPFGDKYAAINQLLLGLAKSLEIDLWILDDLMDNLENREEAEEAAELTASEGAGIVAEGPASGQRFGLERHLHEFLRDNWDQTELGKEWKLYEEDGDTEAGYEYPCQVGRIDLLAKHRSKPRWLVVELKRDQGSDTTVGQVLRYMGWVKSRMAEPGETVEGVVIAHDADEALRFALGATTAVQMRCYEVNFRLKDPEPHA